MTGHCLSRTQRLVVGWFVAMLMVGLKLVWDRLVWFGLIGFDWVGQVGVGLDSFGLAWLGCLVEVVVAMEVNRIR